VNEAVVVEYVELCEQLAAISHDAADERGLHDRLDRLWYDAMSEDDRAEAERRLGTRVSEQARRGTR
jgi:hypothetical protein